MSPILIELCCGSAALARHAFGGAPLLPYWGGKGQFAKRIAQASGLQRPQAAVLFDKGPWPTTLQTLSTPASRDEVVRLLLSWRKEDPRELYERIRHQDVPQDPSLRAAAHLMLQGVQYSGKPVGVRDGRWRCHGFNPTEGFGAPKKPTFGKVAPRLGVTIRRVAAFPTLPIVGEVADIRELDPCDWVTPGKTVVYLDPPYVGTTGYGPGDLTREEVLAIAEAWRAAGALVIVSEGEPLALDGWWHLEITKSRTQKKSTVGRKGQGRRSKAEWLTVCPEIPVAPGALTSDGGQVLMFGGAA